LCIINKKEPEKNLSSSIGAILRMASVSGHIIIKHQHEGPIANGCFNEESPTLLVVVGGHNPQVASQGQ